MIKINGTKIALLVSFLTTGAALHLLSDQGASSMKNFVSPGAGPAGRPSIDDNVPGRLETATFAMG